MQQDAEMRPTECVVNAERIPNESWVNDIRMVAYVLADCDELHKAGHMDPGTFGAIVALAVCRLDRLTTECQLNAD